MTEWPLPRGDTVSPIIDRLCAAEDLQEPLSTLKRNLLHEDLTEPEINSALNWLRERGVITMDSKLVQLSRSVVRAVLRAELRLP